MAIAMRPGTGRWCGSGRSRRMVAFSTTTRTVREPTKYWKEYCMASDRPMVTIISWVSPSPRLSQRLPQDAVLDPPAEAADEQTRQAAEPQVDAGHVDQRRSRPCRPGSPARRARSWRCRSCRRSGESPTEASASSRPRRRPLKLDWRTSSRVLVRVAEVRRSHLEGRGRRLAELTAWTLSSLSGPRSAASGRPQLEALGQRVRVDADEVVAGLGDVEAELAVVLGGLRLGRAVGLGEDDVDVGDRVGSAADGAGDARGLVDLGQDRTWRRRRTGWRAAGGAARRA